MHKSNTKWWHNWVRPQRLFPLATAGGAFIALLLAGLGMLTLSIPEGILISLLGLLAIDALGERMGVLEQIQQSLDIMTKVGEPKPYLAWEPDVFREVPLEKYLQGANELFISGGSLIGLFTAQRETLRRWLSQTTDTKLLLILVDPEAVRTGKVSVESLHIDQDKETYARDIDRSLETITNLKRRFPGKIDVRLTDQTPSLTVMMIDRREARVSINLYIAYPDQRPMFELSKTRHPEWFRLFEERYYVRLWDQSEPFA
jgi:hypothetical protein